MPNSRSHTWRLSGAMVCCACCFCVIFSFSMKSSRAQDRHLNQRTASFLNQLAPSKVNASARESQSAAILNSTFAPPLAPTASHGRPAREEGVPARLTPGTKLISSHQSAMQPPAVSGEPLVNPILDDPLAMLSQSSESNVDSTDCMTLDGCEIACLAAQRWLPADILRQRARTLVQLFSEEHADERQAAQSLARFLCMQAEHQEDIGTATALRAYYTRIALAEQLLLTRESLVMMHSEIDKQKAAQERGLPAGADLSSFERHSLEIQDNQLQILSKDRQLRCVLAQLTGIDYAMSEVCHELLEIAPSPLNCQCLQQSALILRKDLQAWIYLRSQVTEETAPVFAQMLGTLIGNWGMPIPKVAAIKALLCPPDYASLAANMRYELQLLIDTHRGWICQAVNEKCAALELAYGRIHLAQQTIDSWVDRIEQLEQLVQKGTTLPEELAVARSELLKARAEEIGRRLDARLAEIDLAEATGGIRNRCCAGLPWLLTGCE